MGGSEALSNDQHYRVEAGALSRVQRQQLPAQRSSFRFPPNTIRIVAATIGSSLAAGCAPQPPSDLSIRGRRSGENSFAKRTVATLGGMRCRSSRRGAGSRRDRRRLVRRRDALDGLRRRRNRRPILLVAISGERCRSRHAEALLNGCSAAGHQRRKALQSSIVTRKSRKFSLSLDFHIDQAAFD